MGILMARKGLELLTESYESSTLLLFALQMPLWRELLCSCYYGVFIRMARSPIGFCSFRLVLNNKQHNCS